MKRFLVLALFIFPFVAYSQYGPAMGQSKRIIRSTLVHQSFSIEDVDDPIAQTTGPTEIIWPISSSFTLQVLNTPGMASSGSFAISGLSDTYVRGNYTFLDQKALVSVGLGVPSGQSKLDDKEFGMSQLLSHNAFRFRLPVFGQGFTGSAGLAYAFPVSEKLVAGVGFNYVYRAEYEPVINVQNGYNPGDQFGGNVGMDFSLSENARLTVDLIYSHYMPDKFDSIEVFESGDRLSINMGFFMQSDLWSFYGSGLLRQKGKNQTYDGQSLALDEKNMNGPQLEINGIARYSMSDAMGVRGYVELRALGENEEKSGDAAVYGLGAGIDYAVTRAFSIETGAKAFFGRVGGGTNAKSLGGFEAWFGTGYAF